MSQQLGLEFPLSRFTAIFVRWNLIILAMKDSFWYGRPLTNAITFYKNFTINAWALQTLLVPVKLLLAIFPRIIVRLPGLPTVNVIDSMMRISELQLCGDLNT